MGRHATPEVTHALHSHVTYGTLCHARGHSRSFSHPSPLVSFLTLPWTFCCCFSFISRLLFHATGTPSWLLRLVKASTSSELYPDYFWLPLLFHLPRALRFWMGVFYPQAFFTLRSFTAEWFATLPHPPFLPWVLRIWESVFYCQAFFTLHSLYLRKQRIFLGVIDILIMYLRLQT